ncbi:MAG: hypothetical protein IJ572_00725 [Bacilli bacterium]|nr:hypothetical protein [Bacilli bacterium]
MNRIIRKTMDGIEQIKKANKSNYELNIILDKIIDAINLNYTYSNINTLIDMYNTIEVILFNACNLNDKEAGFILNKIMKYNFKVNKNIKNIVIRYEVFEDKGLNRKETNSLLKRFYEDDDSLTKKELSLLNDILDSEAKANQFIKDAYEYIEKFSLKRSHSNFEYEELIKSLENLSVPKSLIDSYIAYYKSKEIVVETPVKVTNIKDVEKEKLPSRKELKNRLNELYHPEAEYRYFDLKDINEVLKLINSLNISDERAKLILENLCDFAIKNDNYYNYLIDKIKYLNKYSDQIQDIDELKELLKVSDEEAKKDINSWLQEIYETLEPLLTSSFDYEMKLKRSL